MKQQQVWFHCDAEDCDEESPPETRWPEATKTARRHGWSVENRPLEDPIHLCPEHKSS